MTQDKSASMPPLPPKLGKYVIRDLLGSGSVGMVFRARDPSLERDVAIKVMAGPSLHDSSMQLRFEKEAKAVAQLHHPNIVTVHDLGYDDRGSPFIAMELLDGCDLDQLVEKEQPTLARKPGIVVQVCHGLAHANANGIVHRDIKPANIFVARDGTAKIMDFGVARWTQSSQTQAGIVVGTAGYIAPEQLRGHAVDGRADVFSIGVVLFELVTNQLLFSGDNIETIFFKTLTKSTPRLRFPDNRSLPGLQQIVEGALAKDPSERYATAGDMARAIEAFLHAYESELEKQRICLVLEHDSGVPDPEDETMRSKSVEPAPRKRPSSRRPTRRIAVPTHIAKRPTTASRKRASNGRRRSRSRSALEYWPAFAAVLTCIVAAGLGSYLSLFKESSSSASETTTTTSVPIAPQPTEARPEPRSAPPPSQNEELSALIADGALAIGAGDLKRARVLIQRAELLEPKNDRLRALGEQLRIKEVEQRRAVLSRDRITKAKRLVSQGAYEEAITLFEGALELDPGNAAARSGLDGARARVERAQAETMRPTVEPFRRYVESETAFTSEEPDSERFLGFEMEDRFAVKETVDPSYPAKLIIELDPKDAMPGEPYTIRVSVFNEGYRPIALRELELVNVVGDKATGKGQPVPIQSSEVAPQSTTVLYEISGTWKESQLHGAIEVTVSLVDEGRLTKSLRW